MLIVVSVKAWQISGSVHISGFVYKYAVMELHTIIYCKNLGNVYISFCFFLLLHLVYDKFFTGIC